ncbi:hypothetical protein ACGFJT_44365 [Actinomadura geliboluensis]|uniref:hypothetical protein n=1 Tax=Actinomadura geliboluensis TaxID=882440 RepID=UPI003711E583
MTPTSTTLPFFIERTYDVEMASDGESRYGVYARQIAVGDPGPWDMAGEDGRHAFASMAWRAATGPVMSPGYVRYHPLISGANVFRSHWDGSLAATVELRTPPPAGLARMHRWRSWPTESNGDEYVPVSPSEQDVARRSDLSAGYALTTVTLAFALHDLALPDPPPTPDSPALAHTAAVAVGSLVGALNDVVTPVIDGL